MDPTERTKRSEIEKISSQKINDQMSGPNHMVGGVVFTGIYMSMFNVNIFSSPWLLFLTSFFSVLPDVDHTKSAIGKTFYPIAKYLDKKFGHRTITHSLAIYIALILLVGFIDSTFIHAGASLAGIATWAYGSHLIFDMMTLQGVPLFYPFKKNACVIPGNPAFRFRSSDLKTEFIVFAVFLALGISCASLFQNGFWNTYNRSFNTTKHIYAEAMIHPSALQVEYKFTRLGHQQSGKGWYVEGSRDKLLLFDSAAGFIVVEHTDHISQLLPVRTTRTIQVASLNFTDIGLDSFRSIIADKAIQSLKIATTEPLEFSKDNKPQSASSIDLDHVFNPTFTSNISDSIDAGAEKELNLLQLDIARNREEQQQFLLRKNAQQKIVEQLAAAVQSADLVEKEQAINHYDQEKQKLLGLVPPLDNSHALQIRLQYLQSRLKIIRQLKISGYLSYFTLQ